jgi:hypothetical protein
MRKSHVQVGIAADSLQAKPGDWVEHQQEGKDVSFPPPTAEKDKKQPRDQQRIGDAQGLSGTDGS